MALNARGNFEKRELEIADEAIREMILLKKV